MYDISKNASGDVSKVHNPQIRIDKYNVNKEEAKNIDYTKPPYNTITCHKILFASIVGTVNKACDVRITGDKTITLYNGHVYNQDLYVMVIYV